MFAIAATNAVLCLVVLIKAVHVCVGLVSFISVAMMVIGRNVTDIIMFCPTSTS